MQEDKSTTYAYMSYDHMQAFLRLSEPDEWESYTVSEMVDYLKTKNVVKGIKTDVIRNMIDKKQYGEEVLVAEGVKQVDGEDGYFDFKFTTKKDRKPKILEDGSADYSAFNIVENVSKDQVVAKYVKATTGSNGYDVTGKTLLGKNGKELPPLKGKGFKLEEDNVTYVATLDGKVDLIDGRLNVSNIHEIKGDVDHTTGNISFNGDLIIHGNVSLGCTVKASGTITVEGTVEAAYIEAGKDVILKNGMQGAQRGTLTTKGDVYTKFLEQVKVRADGNVYANAIMNCDIESRSEIVLNGKMGVLIGGRTRAVKGIIAMGYGNLAQAKTEVIVGMEESEFDKIDRLKTKQKKLQEEVREIENALIKFDKLKEKMNIDNKEKMLLVRKKIELMATLNEMTDRLKAQFEDVENSRGAKIVAYNAVYPGVLIKVDSNVLLIKAKKQNVVFAKNGAEITMKPAR